MTSSPASKRQKTTSTTTTTPPTPPYELLYWPGIPGRGEHIRLCFEETQTPYTDTCNTTPQTGMPSLKSLIAPTATGNNPNPPPLAPPILRHGDLLLSQTPNILLYLAPKLNLAGHPDDENAIYHINQLALTALDGLSNEAHDSHHPIAISMYYEEQKEEAKRKAEDFIKNRLPKFLGYFERVLQGGEEGDGGGEWLYGGRLTYADLVLWQCVDGVGFAFPVAVGRLREGGLYGRVFGLCGRVGGRENVKAYLESGRRLKYSSGIYRHYPELDAEEEK